MLTILVPLKGRHLHTLRFLWHANRSRMPYHLLLADGAEEVNRDFTALLENATAIFPNLNIEYVRYPADDTYTQFYRKMADALARVRTPFVMQAANDDFLLQSGIDSCVAFLRSNSDFASCSGGIGGFALLLTPGALNNVVGRLRHVSFRCMAEYAARDDTAPSLAERIRMAFGCIHTTYFNVFRSEALGTILRELAELDLTDLQLYEVYFGMRAVSLGKARLSHQSMSYIRQGGTGMAHPFRTDWGRYVVRSRFTTDLNAVADRMENIVAAAEGLTAKDFAAEVRDMFGVKLSNYLRSHYGSFGGGSLSWSARMKKMAHAVIPKRVGESIHYARSRQFMLKDLQSAGASAATMAAFAKEWADIESLLGSHELAEFLHAHASFLLDETAPKGSDASLVQ